MNTFEADGMFLQSCIHVFIALFIAVNMLSMWYETMQITCLVFTSGLKKYTTAIWVNPRTITLLKNPCLSIIEV